MENDNNDNNENKTGNVSVKNTPGRKRSKLTKTLKVVQIDNKYQMLGRGKPKSGSVIGEITVPFDFDATNGVPADMTVENVRTVKYETKTKVVAPTPAFTPIPAAVQTPVAA